VSREDAVLEAVVGWIQVAGGELRGWKLLSKIRYCVLGAEYLAVDVHRLLPAELADRAGVRIKAAGGQRGSIGARLLGEKVDVRRRWPDVRLNGNDIEVASGGFKAIRMYGLFKLLNARS
jgi:hypothetical protein